MDQSGGRELIAHAPKQGLAQRAFFGAKCRGVPFVGIRALARDKSRLTTHGQAHVVTVEPRVGGRSQRIDRLPRLVGVRAGDAGPLLDSEDFIAEVEMHLAFPDPALHRRAGPVVRGARERDVAFARQKTRGGIEPHPAGTRQVDLSPGVQIGKVRTRARGAFDRDLILNELHQIARDKATCKTEQSQRLHQKPCAVAAAPRATPECLGRALYADLFAQRVLDVGGESLVKRHQKIHRFAVAAVDTLEPASELRAVVLNLEVGL